MPKPTSGSQRIAFITGGARGIGRQIATDLLASGYRVVIGDLDLAATTTTATELGAGALAVHLDITKPESISAAIIETTTTVGPIDVWVNNAGIMPTGYFADQPLAQLTLTIDIDFTGLVAATHAILPLMVERGSGTIINIASATGVKPLAGLAVYSGAKAAVIAFSSSLRRELRGTGVTVSVIAPNLASTALGAGITPPAITGIITAQTISSAVMRVLKSGKFATVVPRPLGLLLRFSKALPIPMQDWIDDRVGSDRIGLGGDPATRAAYIQEVVEKKK
jgi:short-subunit dehydrogenase